MGFAVNRPSTAFSLSPTDRKRPAKKDADYLKWLHELPCVVTGVRPVDPAHVSYADPRYGKRERGKSEKADDRWAVPLCRAEHDKQHSMDERAYWQSVGIDPLQVALAIYGVKGDNTMAEIIIRNARQKP
ncbi:hypothetical protein C5748_18115 [Phyllobacterium phragmitis]|uniref:DUF968 domain-containing protein n=1 Tax=Phyllobacterium phragmitis TaxID=2670329 RepID=A0A2S9INH2_9HYPH|nr:DUF968 domain-containing protein [Phyllobacterium phragmitis]PRD42073.1 hypothetical protein C5748_18115 [Phyllobacterium phragmitis]